MSGNDGNPLAREATVTELWEARLLKRKDRLVPHEHNAALYLRHDPEWRGCVRMNAFTGEIEIMRELPIEAPKARAWTDVHTSLTSGWLATQRGLVVKAGDVDRAVRTAAALEAHHPVRDWLHALPPWDGVERLNDLMPRAFSTEANEYTAFVGGYLLVALVARVMEPGCQADYCPVLEGKQGIGKSSGLRALVGFAPGLHMDLVQSPSDREFAMSLRGAWLVEIGEMNAFNKSDVTRIKQAITTTVDKFREPYARHHEVAPRQCVFVGTTNEDQYLQDTTGNRRFLPVLCRERVDVEYLRGAREQLFAEALARWRPGGEAGGCWPYWDAPAAAVLEQEDRRISDSWEDVIERWLDSTTPTGPADPPGTKRQFGFSGPIVSVELGAVLEGALLLEPGRCDRVQEARARRVLRLLGWECYRPGTDGSRKRAYRRGVAQ